MPAILVTVPTVMQNSFINFLLIACHLLDFMVQGKITEADAPTSHHPIRTIGAPTSVIPIFTQNALSAATLPIYPGLDYTGLHTRWLGYTGCPI